MAETEDELAVALRAEDEMTGVVESASQAYEEAMEEMARASSEAAAETAKVGSTATEAASRVSEASTRIQTSWQRVGESAERAGRGGHGAMKRIAEFGHSAHQSLAGLKAGAGFATDSVEKLAHASVNVGSKFLKMAASGNYVTAALLAGTAVWGYFQEKAERAAKAHEKAVEDSLKATEKLASEGTRLAQQAAEDDEKASKDLAETRIYIENEALTAIQNRRNADIAKVGYAEANKLKVLEERIAKENELLAKAEAARASAKSDPERKVAEDTAAAARGAIEHTKSAQAKEREAAAQQRTKIEAEYTKAAEQESLRLREQSVAVLNRLHEVRMRDRQVFDEQVASKVRSLGYDKDALAVASDLEKIEALRRQGRDKEAGIMASLLAIEKAKAQLEKDRDALKARAETAIKLNKEGALEERRMRSVMGLRDNERRVLEEVYTVYERIRDKIREGMDFTQAATIYEMKRKEILDEYYEAASRRLGQYAAETHALTQQYQELSLQKDMQGQIESARERGASAEAMALSDKLKSLDDANDRLLLYQKYQEEVTAAAKEGDAAKISALEQQYTLAQKILAVKQKETEEQKTQRNLAAAGISVNDAGLTGTHANKGLRDRWQERNRRSREEKLARQARNQGAGFGVKAGDEMGFTLGPGDDFSRTGGGGGDMGMELDTSRTGNSEFVWPELDKPAVPKLPTDLNAPKLNAETGEGPQAQLAGIEEQLKAFAEQQRQLNEALGSLGKTMETLPGLEKLIAEAAKATDSSAKDTGKNVADTQKTAADLAKTMGDFATASGTGMKDLANKHAELKKKVDDFFKALEDVKKMGG